MSFHDNEDYWIQRHESLRGSIASVGKIGTPEVDNRQRYARKKRKVVDLLRSIHRLDLRGMDALDAGCGTGLISEVLFALGATVHGVDASPIAVSEARDRAGPPPNNPDNFRTGSLVDFSFSKLFDLTFCLDVLYHVVDDQNWEIAVRNLVSQTKRTGLLILLDQVSEYPERPATHVRFRTRAMYAAVLSAIGGTHCETSATQEFLVYRFA